MSNVLFDIKKEVVMKKYTVIALLVAIFAMDSNAVPTGLQGANYQQFSSQLKGYMITPANVVDYQWVLGAVTALRRDRIYNENDFAKILWSELQPAIHYMVQLPQNKNNPDLVNRLYGSLTRSLQEIQTQGQLQQRPVYQQPSSAAPRVPQVSSPQPVMNQSMPSAPVKAVLDGSLGVDYMNKAREIYNYNYDKSTKGGFINLRNSLIKSIEGEMAAPSSSSNADTKKSIDSFHHALQKYRARDGQ